jgi:predicted NAD/FAD-binding protein
MRVAIVGTGISGLVAGWKLNGSHDLTVFEAGSHIGGHTNTVPVAERDGRFVRVAGDAPGAIPVDTGFIVHNPVNYPVLCRIFSDLGVATRDTVMSFGVACDRTQVEWAGTDLSTVFAQRRNLLSPPFLGMLRDLIRFNDLARRHLLPDGPELPLGEFIERHRIHARTVEHYIIPMGAAIWSAPPDKMMAFPARRFAQFLNNHGMLQAGDERPIWRTVVGGAWSYVGPITAGWRERIRLDTPVRRVRRTGDAVEVHTDAGGAERFDRVIMACHSDQALALIEQPTADERAILGELPYQENPAVLHDDTSLMPSRTRAWSAWNYRVGGDDAALVTYWMNRLQGFTSPRPLLVSLNADHRIAADRVIYRTVYQHPEFRTGAPAAQRRRSVISGADRIHFCGAYWGNGFHEDGAASGLAVAGEFGAA